MILSGILLTPTGFPYKNSTVQVVANNTSEQVLKFTSKEFKTGADGSYEIDVPNGWYHVSVLVSRAYTNIGNIEITDATTQTTINELLMLDQTAHSDGLAQQVADDAASAEVSKNEAEAAAAYTESLLGTKVSVSDLANNTDPNKGAGQTGYRNSNVYLKLSDFIAAHDFVGTDAEAITAAGEYCYINKKQLRLDRNVTIPTLADPVDLMCGLYQQPGTTINISNLGITKGLFRFKTAQTGTVITGVGGLTEGSTKLTGLPATVPGSWLLIESSEELIRDTSANFYVKQEVVVVADILGGLASPLNSTYTTPTVTLFTPEPPLVVQGLSIKGDGVSITNSSHNLVEAYRCSVKFDGINVAGIPNNGSQIKFNQCVGCVVKEPNITGGMGGNGYGILAFMTENLFIENPTISNCRHAYAARHDKNTIITGGSMSEIIDSHWGQNLIISKCNIIGQVQYAGRDLSITECQQTPQDYCIRIRNTSPELKGKVIYRGNTVNLDSTRMAGPHFAYITSGLSTGTFDFGRNLAQPNLVVIKENHLNIVSIPTNITYARMLTSQGFSYSLPTRYEIEGNTRTDYTKTIDILTGFVKADNVDFTVNPSVYVRFENNCRLSITSWNTLPDVGKGFALEFRDLTGFIMFASPNTLVGSKLRDVSCAGWALPTASTQALIDNGKLNQQGMTFTGAVPIEYSRIMTGEIFFKSMANNSSSYFKPSKEFGHISVVTQNSLQWSGMAGYDVQASGAFNNTVFNGASFATTTGVLTGTTGSVGNLTVSPATDGKVYIENRAGAALTIQIKELNMS